MNLSFPLYDPPSLSSFCSPQTLSPYQRRFSRGIMFFSSPWLRNCSLHVPTCILPAFCNRRPKVFLFPTPYGEQTRYLLFFLFLSPLDRLGPLPNQSAAIRSVASTFLRHGRRPLPSPPALPKRSLEASKLSSSPFLVLRPDSHLIHDVFFRPSSFFSSVRILAR